MKKILSLFFVFFFIFNTYAQSSEVVTEIINSPTATFGQICYFVSVHQGFISEDADYNEAIKVLYNKGQIPRVVYEDTPIPLANIAYLYAQMWNVKGGVMYKLFNGAPRYAFKQLKADGVIPQNKNPRSTISGLEALNIYTTSSIVYGRMQLYVD